jgi:hypothetical protein
MVRGAVRQANSRRFKVDPAFREEHRVTTRTWRGKVRRRLAGTDVVNAGRVRGSAFRSRMEDRLVPPLLAIGAEYEPIFLRYVQKPRGYTPDVVLPNGIALEIKGWFTPADRAKMLDVKRAFPALDLRLILASPRQKLGRQSATTQAAWCEQHGFPWADNAVPASWLAEPENAASAAILRDAPRHRSKTRRVA